jgi:hypothetical protein
MNYPPLTPDILQDFLEEILGSKEQIQITRPRILTLTQLIDASRRFHVDANILWRIKAWHTSQEMNAKRKEASDIYNSILFERKEKLAQLTQALMNAMKIDKESAFPIALKMLQHKVVAGAELFGVDIKDVPELPAKHMIIDGGIIYEL